MKFLRKRKASKIKKLKTRVIELENDNETLEDKNEILLKELFRYKLQCGELPKPKKQRALRKLIGNRGQYT